MKSLSTFVFAIAFTFFAPQPFAQPIDSSEQQVAQSDSIVSINVADADTLASLKGIGNKKAQAIIFYREENGRFNSVEELLNVKGIGTKVLEDNRQRLKI